MAPCLAPCLALGSSVAISSRPACRAIGGRQAAPRRLPVCAAGADDLDEAWARFKQTAKIKFPEVEERSRVKTAPPPPRFQSDTLRSGEWNRGSPVDQMRKQEMAALDAWTQDRFMLLAAGGTMAVVLVLLMASGGPPADPRCTLPWC